MFGNFAIRRKIRIKNQYFIQTGCFKKQFRECDGLFLSPLNKILFILNLIVGFVLFCFLVPDFESEMGKFLLSVVFFQLRYFLDTLPV